MYFFFTLYCLYFYFRLYLIKVCSQDLLRGSGTEGKIEVPDFNMIFHYSLERYWLLLLVILALNILLIISDNDTVCPISISYENGTLSEGFEVQYIALTVLLGGLFAFLAVWMLMEYFIVTWPHFVLPEFFYDKLCELLSEKSRLGR